MRKLKQIIKLEERMGGYMELPGSPAELMALDENGELWHGTLENTEDQRRVINWTPVNTPKDGAAYSEPQQSFFDKWEKEAHERLQTEAEAERKIVSLETITPNVTGATGGQAGSASDDSVEDGEGTDPAD